MTVVVATNLCRTYGSRRGISDVNLTINAGEIFGFLGPNGAGKSTTIRVLMGLLRPSSGAARIFGRDCWSDGPAIRRDVGYVAGDVRLYPWLTPRRGLRMISRIHGRDLLPNGLKLAERFRLEPDLVVRKMSRGNRQKVALVLALAHSPRLVILDEPTSGLDPLMQDTLMLCLREMAGAGHTVMFSSHTLSEVETLCDRIAIVRDGRIVEDSTLNALKEQAPRQIVVTLQEQQSASGIQWPNGVNIKYLPDTAEGQTAPTIGLLVPPSLRHRTCILELLGTSAPFMRWAAEQNFADVVIGSPSLEVLFRRYYESTEPGSSP
ncbi:MAG TPA: ABC transporter ATP-binding protein [Planctomycetaceae bacterium]|nr:ABC transporter ATP-binding protein [Planctomycetaceae bacterium]